MKAHSTSSSPPVLPVHARQARQPWIMAAVLAAALGFLVAPARSQQSEPPPKPPKPPETTETNPPATPAPVPPAAKDVKLPGLSVNLRERSVDVEATVCLTDGALELVACTKDTKEHESIIRVAARPVHIHTALLLLGAKPGNPAMRKPLDEDGQRWLDLPPRGGPVDVFLVFKDKEGKTVERPVNEFIVRRADDSAPPADNPQPGEAADKPVRFPTHTFLFAGSLLHGDGQGPRSYLCDHSGNVISLVSFGDELLCLPEIHSQDNGMLMWEVDATDLPALGSPLILRLRPQARPAAPADQK